MSGRTPLALVGPTASGKTEASLALADALGAEIVSVDSMLVYRGMDVGTAKPTAAERDRIRHHLVNLVEPSEPFSAAMFQAQGRAALLEIADRGRRALLVGCSGLYFRALVDDLEFPRTDSRTREILEREASVVGAERLHSRLSALDPVAASKIDPGNVRRTVRALEVAAVTGKQFSSFARAWDRYDPDRVAVAGVSVSPGVLDGRIRQRVASMLERGLLDEVRRLVKRGLEGWLTATQAIGYAEFARHLAGDLTLEEATEITLRRTKNLARRQMAWLRRDVRIRWFEAGREGAAGVAQDIRSFLESA